MYSKGTWTNLEDLKGGYDTFTEAFTAFLETDQCPTALLEIIENSRKDYNKRKRKENKQAVKKKDVNAADSNSDSDSDYSDTDSELEVAGALLRDLADDNAAHISEPLY